MKEVKQPIDTEFVECDTCRAKPGSPYLCSGCLKNRQIINTLLDYIRTYMGRAKKQLDKFGTFNPEAKTFGKPKGRKNKKNEVRK